MIIRPMQLNVIKTVLAIFLFVSIPIQVQGISGPSHDRVVVCYTATWAAYRPPGGAFTIDDLDPSLCTHLVYAFAGLDVSSIKPLDAWQDLADNYGKAGYDKATGLKKRYPHLKVTLAIGGWNEGSQKYSKLAENPELRKKFIESSVQFLNKFNFDGLDLDWEYPAKRGGLPHDKANFAIFVKELKTEFEKHSLILTAALGASKETIDVGYDVGQLSQYLDLIHIMCYDYHGTWDGIVGPNSPLYGETDQDPLSVEFTVNYMIKMGAPAYKLVLGLPLYGRTFIRDSLADVEQPPRAPLLGITKVKPAGFPGPFTKEAGFMGFNEICTEMENKTAGWEYSWDEKSHTPFVYSGDKFITYDNEQSIVEKVRFAVDKNLRGLMVWSIDTDDFRGNCPIDKNAFNVFHKNLDQLQNTPYMKQVLPTLGIKENNNDSPNVTTPNNFNNLYKIHNGRIVLNIPPMSNTNYPLMRSLGHAVHLAQNEQDLKHKINIKIKEIERENEIINGVEKHSSSASNLCIGKSVILLTTVTCFISSTMYL